MSYRIKTIFLFFTFIGFSHSAFSGTKLLQTFEALKEWQSSAVECQVGFFFHQDWHSSEWIKNPDLDFKLYSYMFALTPKPDSTLRVTASNLVAHLTNDRFRWNPWEGQYQNVLGDSEYFAGFHGLSYLKEELNGNEALYDSIYLQGRTPESNYVKFRRLLTRNDDSTLVNFVDISTEFDDSYTHSNPEAIGIKEVNKKTLIVTRDARLSITGFHFLESRLPFDKNTGFKEPLDQITYEDIISISEERWTKSVEFQCR